MSFQAVTRTARVNPIAVCAALFLLGAASVVSADGAKRIDEGRQPQVASAPDGRHYVVYAKGGAVYCAAAPAGEERFSPPVKVAVPRNVPVGMRRGPRVAATDGAIIVTAIS